MNGDPDRELARTLRLRGEPPPAVRLSRPAFLLCGAAAAALLAVVVGLALRDPHKPAAGPSPAPPQVPPPERLAALPHDYLRPPADAPRLGPPLPGDLGRPILAAGQASAAAPAGDHADPLQQARGSRIFAVSASARPQSASPALAAPQLAPANPASERPVGVTLRAGSTIRAALVTGVRSDLPGPVLAQVTEDVYDSDLGRRRLVPRGSRLVGAYDDRVAFGQKRVLLTWSRLLLPDGRTVDLARAVASDPQGFVGLRDGVRQHWGQLIGASMVSLVIGAGRELGRSGDPDAELVEALRTDLADTASQVGARVVDRSLQVKPTLTIRPGYEFRVLLTEDLILPAEIAQ